MKRTLALIILASPLLSPFVGHGQELHSINYSYLYSQSAPFTFQFRPARGMNEWQIAFSLKVNDGDAQPYRITWEVRESFSDSTGSEGYHPVAVLISPSSKGAISGVIRASRSLDEKILVGKVTHTERRQVWLFFTVLRKDFPGNGFLKNKKGDILVGGYISPGDTVRVSTLDSTSVSFLTHYQTDFPAAVPAFSEGMASVSSTLSLDSTRLIPTDSSFVIASPGAYLFQGDTLSPTGHTIMAFDDYPKYTRFRNLTGPLVYICTKSEFDRLRQAGEDKKAFDRVILSITGNSERARIFMRSYFRRVELANTLFTSYKEGWKTDRGMILIIFGVPETVYRFKDREVWTYKNSTFTGSFDFVRSGTLFDPDNYVLIRNQKYKEDWYEIVDLWRNARF